MADELITQADELQLQGKVSDMYTLLSKALSDHSENVNIMWRYSRSCYEYAEEKEDKAWKEEYFKKGLEEAKKAVELCPADGKAQKWTGILLSKVGDFISTKEKIGNAFIIKEHFQKAADADPADATVQHCLGAWCWNIAGIGWMERKAASLLFGTPPESTYEEAEGFYLKASEIDANFLDNAFALGELYAAMKRWEDAKKWYTTCANMKTKNDKEQRLAAEAKTRAGKL